MTKIDEENENANVMNKKVNANDCKKVNDDDDVVVKEIVNSAIASYRPLCICVVCGRGRESKMEAERNSPTIPAALILLVTKIQIIVVIGQLSSQGHRKTTA